MDDRSTRVASLDEIGEGETLLVYVDGEPVCLYNLQGRIFATQDRCTHGSASLSEGWIEDDRILCPLHHGEFQIATGKACAIPCSVDLRTYPVRIEGREIHVGRA